MKPANPTTIGQRIRWARNNAGLTQQQVADHFGIARVSVTQWEGDKTAPESDKYPELARLLDVPVEWLIAQTGPVPVSKELLSTLESSTAPRRVKVISSFDPDTYEQSDDDPSWTGVGAGRVDGRLNFKAALPGGMAEIAASTGAGLGKVDDDRAVRIMAQGIAAGHPVVNEWVIPNSYVRNGLGARPSEVIILPVVGHSMEPLLRANDRILVDTSQNVWMGDAVYVISDGDSILRVKTVKKVTSSNPPRYRIVSEANPNDPETLDHDQFQIVGRVVGRFSQM